MCHVGCISKSALPVCESQTGRADQLFRLATRKPEEPKKLATLSVVANTSRLDWNRPTTSDTVAGWRLQLPVIFLFSNSLVVTACKNYLSLEVENISIIRNTTADKSKKINDYKF